MKRTTRFQCLLRNTTLDVDPTDARQIDVLASGLPLHMGRPLFCDVSLRSPLAADGSPHPGATTTDGATFRQAQRDKHRKYADVAADSRTELVVLAAEVGGRWNQESLDLVRQLAAYKAGESPPLLRRSVELAWTDRWWSLLSIAVQSAFAASLLASPGPGIVLDTPASPVPDVDLLLDGLGFDEFPDGDPGDDTPATTG